MKLYQWFLSIIAWITSIFKPSVKLVSPTVWEEMANKQKAMNPVLWKRLIQKLKSRKGQQLILPLNKRQFKTFGTFKAIKPFMCNHKTFS